MLLQNFSRFWQNAYLALLGIYEMYLNMYLRIYLYITFQAFLTWAAFPSSGDIAPMEASHSLRPMKSLAPPGLIAAGRVWHEVGSVGSHSFAKNLHFCKIAFGPVEIVS